MICIICIMGADRGIGLDNKLIQHIPCDMARFRRLTTGHTVVMGRKTFESIGRPLPQRRNIVLSRNGNLHIPGVSICHSIQSAISESVNEDIYIIGGGSVFEQTIQLADRLLLTITSSRPEADTFFPEYTRFFAKVLSREDHDYNGTPYTFLDLAR